MKEQGSVNLIVQVKQDHKGREKREEEERNSYELSMIFFPFLITSDVTHNVPKYRHLEEHT